MKSAELNVEALRNEFPILSQDVNGKPLVYLDNAATTQKPQCVIDALVDYYSTCNSNVHRGAHRLADEATRRFEDARQCVAGFLNAERSEEVIWTRGTTEGINMVANGMVPSLHPGDEVLVTAMEHHANLIPWQQACERSGARLVIAPITELGELDLVAYRQLLSENTRLVAFPHVSNALGTVNPVRELALAAKEFGALVLVDGAQGAPHGGVDVQSLGCDFYAFSGHKIYGPTGIGVLWGKASVLESLPVWQTGGEMISEVTYESAVWNQLPYRFEAGTPNIAGAIGLGAAVRWFQSLDRAAVAAHEAALMQRATELAADFPELKQVGQAAHKLGAFSFLLAGGHPADVGFLLDQQGIAIRTGHHCAEPLMGRLGIPGTARASFAIYNTLEEVDQLFAALRKAVQMLG